MIRKNAVSEAHKAPPFIQRVREKLKSILPSQEELMTCSRGITELLRDNKAFKILAKRSGVAATEWATLLVVVMNAKKDGYDCRAIVDECTKTYRSLSETVNSNG